MSFALGKIITIATGESVPITDVFEGGYVCPWCRYPVFDPRGCGNPACFARVDFPPTAERIAEIRAQRAAAHAEREQREADSARRAAILSAGLAASRAAEDSRWAAVNAEAERRGACLVCLRKSDWRSDDRVHYVRHRGQCPRLP